jgi:hypothetical protein
MRSSFFFSDETRMATIRNATQLHNLKSSAEKMMPDVGGPITFLCSTTKQHESARTIKSWGVIFIGEELLLRTPSEIALTVAIHELFHLRMGMRYQPP